MTHPKDIKRAEEIANPHADYNSCLYCPPRPAKRRREVKLENQVCSLELAKRLKELGVKQESYFDWYSVKGDREKDCYPSYDDGGYGYKLCSAFTVAEMGKFLPINFASYRIEARSVYWACAWHGVSNENSPQAVLSGNTEADARAKMLIYLIENNLIDFNGLITKYPVKP